MMKKKLENGKKRLLNDKNGIFCLQWLFYAYFDKKRIILCEKWNNS